MIDRILTFVIMSEYTAEDKEQIIIDICDNVVTNKISFNKAVEESPISLVSFYKWLAASKELQTVYNYAREVRSDILFEEIIEIADTPKKGKKTKNTPKGMIIEKGDMTDHRRLQIDARKWVVAKMNPKKYGRDADTAGDDSDNEIIVHRR